MMTDNMKSLQEIGKERCNLMFGPDETVIPAVATDPLVEVLPYLPWSRLKYYISFHFGEIALHRLKLGTIDPELSTEIVEFLLREHEIGKLKYGSEKHGRAHA